MASIRLAIAGLGKYYREVVEESPAPAVDVAGVLRETEADV
jgi:hypothetical protein